MMELHVVVFILFWLQAASKVYWIVSNKPVIYGDNIILTCKTGHVLTDRRGGCSVRQWHGGHKNKLLLFNKVSGNAAKYEGGTNVSSTEFSLVIKNYTESDLNINYTCSCGFKSYTKRLGLNDKNFIVPPLTVNTNIQQFNETLSIYICVERVYPRPGCSVDIGERTVFDKLTFTSVKRGKFYYGTFEACFDIVADDCGKKPTLLCYIGNEYNIVNTSGEPIRNCTVRHTGSTHVSISTSTDTYTTYVLSVLFGVSLFLLACFYTRKLRLYTWCKGHKRALTTRNSSLQASTNETDNHQNDSLYDEIDSVSYQSVTYRHYACDDNVSVHHSIASDDTTVYDVISSDDEAVYHLIASDDNTVHHSIASDDTTVYDVISSDDEAVYNLTASDDEAVYHSIASDDKRVQHSSASDDKTVHHSTASDDKTVDHIIHSDENVQDMDDEHDRYLQTITVEGDVTFTKDNSSCHFTVRCGPHVN